MKVTLSNNRPVYFHFIYGTKQVRSGTNRTVKAVVEFLDGENRVVNQISAVASCDHRDKFSKVKGRAAALSLLYQACGSQLSYEDKNLLVRHACPTYFRKRPRTPWNLVEKLEEAIRELAKLEHGNSLTPLTTAEAILKNLLERSRAKRKPRKPRYKSIQTA